MHLGQKKKDANYQQLWKNESKIEFYYRKRWSLYLHKYIRIFMCVGAHMYMLMCTNMYTYMCV